MSEELTQDQRILYSLASSMEKTRIELDALRLVSQAALATVCSNPQLEQAFVAALKAATEADTAFALNSQMTDLTLEKRLEWIKRLVPKRVVLHLPPN